MISPLLVRYRDAPAYLGMDRNRFDSEVRPALTEIPIGQRGIAFDRLNPATNASNITHRAASQDFRFC